MRFAFTNVLLLLNVVLLTINAVSAQERTTRQNVVEGSTPALISNINALQTSLTIFTNQINQPCTSGGNIYQHGQSWVQACPAGFTGQYRSTCVHGVAAMTEYACQTLVTIANPQVNIDVQTVAPVGTAVYESPKLKCYHTCPTVPASYSIVNNTVLIHSYQCTQLPPTVIDNDCGSNCRRNLAGRPC